MNFTCHKCEELLPLNEDNFFRNKNTKTGFSYDCKDCNRKCTNEPQQDNKLPMKVNMHKFDDSSFDTAACRDFVKRMLKPDVSVDKSIL